MVDAGAIYSLKLCLQEPELTLKRIAASALSDIAKHSPELAQAVVDEDCVVHLAPLISHHDAKLKRQVTSALGQISKHSVDLAEVVVEAEIFPKILFLLKDQDLYVRKNAATCIREIAKHTLELAKLIVNAGGAAAMVDYVSDVSGNFRLPGIMTLGYLSAFSETVALSVILAKGIAPLKDALVNEEEDYIRSASAWSLGQIGRHTSEHAREVAQAGVFRHLLEFYVSPDSSEDLKTKCKRALKSVIMKCTYLEALESLVSVNTPMNIVTYVVDQYRKVLPNSVDEKKQFVQCGGYKRLQEISAKAQPGSKLTEYIAEINSCYPEDVRRFYNPNMATKLLDDIDKYGGAH